MTAIFSTFFDLFSRADENHLSFASDVSNTTSITSSESKEAILELTASALTTTAAVADATGVTPSSNGGGGALIKSRDDQDIIEMTHFHDKMTNGVVDDEDIPSDIFDESLRYR